MDPSILKFADDLEGAGWIGAAALSSLGIFKLLGSGPGTLSSTDKGFVWTQNINNSTVDKECSFGIGKLKIQGAAMSISFGVQFKDGLPRYIDVMVSLFSEGNAHSLILEIDEKYVQVADKLLKPATEDPQTPDDVIIGYQNVGGPLEIPLPNGAIEFNFRIDEEFGIHSSIQMYGTGNGILRLVSGVIELDIDKVLVFPKFGDLGLYIDKLFIDLSDSEATTFAGLFPEVYDPSWKGIGAGNIVLLFPIDIEDKEFIVAGVSGFLLGFDGRFSGTFNFEYNHLKPSAGVKWLTSELEIRNNEFIRSEVHFGYDLKKAAEELDPKKADTPGILTSREDEMCTDANEKLDEKRPEIELRGILDFRVDFVWHTVNNIEIIGVDLIMETVTLDDDDTPGIILRGTAAKGFFWLVGLGVGALLVKSGSDEGNSYKKAGGVGIIALVLCDIIALEEAPQQVLPELEQLSLDKVGFRWVKINGEHIFQIMLDFRLEFTVKSYVMDLLNGLATFVFGDLGLAGNLFGESLDSVRLEGNIAVEVENFTFFKVSEEARPYVAQLFEQRDFRIRAKKIPQLVFEESQSDGLRPIGGFEFITRPFGTTEEQQFGIAIKIEGLTSADVTVTGPAVGCVIFFWPEWSFEFLPQVTVLPKFTLLLPRLFLAEGIIDLNKPLPAFEGTQSRISINVGAIYKSADPSMKAYLKFSNYKYLMGGEVAWGDATDRRVEPPRKFGFVFAEIHLESSSPLFDIFTMGVYGIGLIFGRNIRPGVANGENNAMGIANWIVGKKAEAGGDTEEVFKNVMDWPAVPAADGSTWHPAIHYDEDNESFDDIYSVGAMMKFGSSPDERKTYKGQGLLIAGYPEFWIAAGAVITFRKINSELTVIIVCDCKSLAIKAIYEVKVDENGSFVRANIWLEFGTVWKDPKRTWLYLGHYLDAKGGPGSLTFADLFVVKGFIDYDSEGLINFGIVPEGGFSKPTITGSAIGFGGALQWGPKRYGPNSVNITLFGMLGANFAFASEPNLYYGEAFLGGYVQLKVLCVKAKLELLLLLNGIKTDTGCRLIGIFSVKLNMPWPIPDWKYSSDFIMQSEGFVPLPAAVVKSTASGMYRMQPIAINLMGEEMATLPIDGIVSITFDKPIYGLVYSTAPADQTSLLLNNDNADDDKISEIAITDYQGVKYQINYVHLIGTLTVTRRPINGGALVTIAELLASWDAPAGYEGGVPDPAAESHHTLFLNSLLPGDLKFSSEQLGEYNSWIETRDHTFPCVVPGLYCINSDPRPAVSNQELQFDTPYGDLFIRQEGVSWLDEDEADLLGDIAWTSSPIRINLPYATHYSFPFVDHARFSIALLNTMPDQGTGKLKSVLHELKIEFIVKLRGRAPGYFNISLRLYDSAPCGWKAELTDVNINTSLISVELLAECAGTSELAMTLELRSHDPLYRIDFVKSKGFRIILNSDLMSTTSHETLVALAEVYAQLATYRLQLANLCIEDSNHHTHHWQQTTIGDSTIPADAVNSLINSMLFEPNHEYTITYKLQSFAAIYRVSDDGTEQVQEKETEIVDLPVVKFKTESTPSQEVERYIGFTFPSKGSEAPYPACLTPLLTFRYQGLILKIYEKYYGAQSLKPLLVDIEGHEVEAVLMDTLTSFSGPEDAALNDLLSSCMSEAQDFVRLQVSIWERTLATNTRYSLQLKHENNGTVPFTISFLTSAFRDFSEHVQYVTRLFDTAGKSPLLNGTSFANNMRDFRDTVMTGTQNGYDDAIEKFYLEFLGVETGKLSPLPDQDYVSIILTTNEVGETITWGIAIELREPLLGKEGVTFDMSDIMPGKLIGMFITPDNTLLMRDFSGSRILLFKQAPDTSIIPFEDPISLTCSFNSKNALRNSIAAYVMETFSDKTAPEQDSLATAQFNQLMLLPHISAAMVAITENLNIEIPEEL